MSETTPAPMPPFRVVLGAGHYATADCSPSEADLDAACYTVYRRDGTVLARRVSWAAVLDLVRLDRPGVHAPAMSS